MKLEARTIRRFGVTAALVAVAIAAVGLSARPADAQGAPAVNAGGPYIGSVNIPITFTASVNTGVPIINYAWNFGDSTTGSGSIAQKSYTTAGTFTVTLTVTANNGQTSSATTTATVGTTPAGTVYSPISPYGVGSVVNPYLNTGVINPYLNTGVINPYLNTGVINPYLNTGVYNPYLNTGLPCGVPVAFGGNVVTSACSTPFVNQTFPVFGSGCFNQPVHTQFGTSFRRICR